jgi:arylsulfatase A-like enzyme
MPSRHHVAVAGLAVLVSLAGLTGTKVAAAGQETAAAGPVAQTGAGSSHQPTAGIGPVVSGDGHGGRPGGGATLGPLIGDKERPNIVVIMADDMRDDDVKYMPNVQRLIGDQGVRFVNSFSPQPLCCPARASFDTGEYTHNHGVWSHADPWGFQVFHDRNTLPVWLSRVGYNTVFFGKYLNGYGRQPLPDGSSSVRYVPPGWTDWRGSIDGGALPPDDPRNGGTYRYFDMTLNDNGTLEPHPGEYSTRMLGRQAEEILRQYALSPRPFFLWASYVAPHHGTPIEPDDPGELVRSDGKSEFIHTPARPADVVGKFDSEITHAPGYRGEPDVSDKPFFIRDNPPMTEEEKQAVLEDTRQRAESLAVLDEQVGKMVDVLKETGQLDNTYVVFTSDNGYFQGEHRMRQGKILPYEPSLRVPTLIRGPGIPAGQTRQDPFTMIDFAPTFLDMAGAQPEPSIDGVSMLDVAEHGDQGWDRGILTETGPRAVAYDVGESDNFLVPSEDDSRFMHRPEGPSPLRFSQGVRTPDYLYVEHASREQELYDLRTDPGELHSVVDRKSERHVVRLLARELDRLRECKGSECARPLPKTLRGP